MTSYTVIAAIVSLYVSDPLYRTVIAWARPLLTDKMQEEPKASNTLGALIWEPSLPNDLRRKYLLSIAFGAIAAFFAVLFAYTAGRSNWTVDFACLLLLTISNGLLS